MKICPCCGNANDVAAPHCVFCGEASFGELSTIVPSHNATPAREAPPAADPPTPDTEDTEPPPEETEPAQADILPGVPAAPQKRGPGRPRKDPPN
mgnify:CR=1 FL=1